MYTLSKHARDFLFECQEDVDGLRKLAHKNYTLSHKHEMGRHLLSYAEERSVVQQHESQLLGICKKLRPAMPSSTIGTALQYFKWFYLHNTTMEYPPMDMLPACLLLACKDEQYDAPLDKLKVHFENSERALAAALSNQHVIRTQLRTQVAICSPFEHAKSMLNALVQRSSVERPENLSANITEYLLKSFLTDACLLYTPTEIAVAAIVNATHISGVSLKRFIVRTPCKKNPEQMPEMLKKLREVRKMVATYKKPSQETLDTIKQKLSDFWGLESNVDYQNYDMEVLTVSKNLKVRQPWLFSKNSTVSAIWLNSDI